MSEPDYITVHKLVERAQRRFESQHRTEANFLYRRALDIDPTSVAALIGIALATRDETERRAALRKVLDIDPSIEKVATWLRSLEEEDRRRAELKETARESIATWRAKMQERRSKLK